MTFFFFFFNDTATTEIYTLSLHDALPISHQTRLPTHVEDTHGGGKGSPAALGRAQKGPQPRHHADREDLRSEEHTSELQSLAYLVCRLLLEKKKKTSTRAPTPVSTHATTS